MARIASIIAQQRGHLFPWLAVSFAGGIGAYFALRFEPGPALLAAVAMLALAAGALAAIRGDLRTPLSLVVLMVALGFLTAAFRAHSVAGAVLEFRYYGAVEGRIVKMDRSASDAVRLTLDRVVLDNVAPRNVPQRVRVSLHGDAASFGVPQPGMRVMTTAHLGPPGGPVEPGGFDFQRHAWFLRLGAVGYTRVPVLPLAAAARDPGLAIFQIRMQVSQHVRDLLPGDIGGFAAAVTTGDRSGISQAALEDLRAANTAHLLAISGLHMGLLSGFVFGLLRVGFALVPFIALRWPVRKLAAGGALGASVIYLALSGGNVATERAFVMAAVVLCAVMLDRRALSLRAVALAALIVLTLRPEALMGPGFQMSFAATTALVVTFQSLRHNRLGWGIPGGQAVLSLLVSSAVAGLATAPIGAAHFNAVSHYGLFANMLSVPLMGVLVIPAAVLAALLAPFGLESLGLWPMGQGLRWILYVSGTVAELEGARSFVPGPPVYVLPVLAVGVLFLLLWQGRARWVGIVPVCVALAGWTQVDRPTVLIAEGGAIVGVMTDAGRALSKAKGAGFVAENWLENDGDRVTQADAAARWPTDGARLGRLAFVHLSGKRAVEGFTSCARNEVIVANRALARPDCTVFDPDSMKTTGAVAVRLTPQGAVFETVRDVTGDRLWSLWPDARVRTPRQFAWFQ